MLVQARSQKLSWPCGGVLALFELLNSIDRLLTHRNCNQNALSIVAVWTTGGLLGYSTNRKFGWSVRRLSRMVCSEKVCSLSWWLEKVAYLHLRTVWIQQESYAQRGFYLYIIFRYSNGCICKLCSKRFQNVNFFFFECDEVKTGT